MPPGGIRTHDLSRRAAADLRLRTRGHWDRHFLHLSAAKHCFWRFKGVLIPEDVCVRACVRVCGSFYRCLLKKMYMQQVES
jgi:hypothetical protein